MSVFLDTLRKHELEQFYPTFSTNGINHLQSLAQLSLQDYSRLGITDTVDRRKIFGLVQSIRKEAPMSSSASTMTSGLRQPQSYSNLSPRRPSVKSDKSPPLRTRTMSDAPRPDLSLIKQPLKDRRLELRRSLYMEPPVALDDEDSEEEEEERKARPLLDAYGVPMSPLRQQQQQQKTFNLPPSDLNQKIRVCVRKRPLSKKELDKGDKDVAPMNGTRSLQINEPKLKLDLSKYTEQHQFTFDDVFDLDCKNTLVYERTALPLVNYIFQGGKATCFAYGQTGSGKTFTMLDPKQGLYILAARDIFSMLRKAENQHLSAWIGLYEIYQGQLYDLLSERKKLFAREDGKSNVIITGLKEYPIDNVDKLIQVFDYGSSVRSTGSTGANDSSSRSHAVLQILLKHKMNRKKIHGKLSFIDLAGSERGADRGEADTKTRMEGAEINKSLLALKECIRALDQDKKHTPFRQSKLTQVLKDSFVGNSRTCMIATISPGGSNSEHTLNTLRYADRVKELKGENAKRSNSIISSEENDEVYMDEEEDYEDDYLSNESDILDDDTFNIDQENIFDVDFPNHDDALIQPKSPIPSPPRYRPTSYQSPTLQQMKRSSSTLPRSLSMYNPTTTHRNSMESDTSSTYSLPPQKLYSPQPLGSPQLNGGVPSFSYEQMDEFVKFHRAEIREITECSKKETKLVANISLDLSSNMHSGANDVKSQMQFTKYLEDLDDVLSRKLAAIEALKDRISETVNQVEL